MSALDDALWPRAALPRRPMLGAVLDALTAWESDVAPPSVWLARGRSAGLDDARCVMQSPAGGFGWRYDWTTTNVADAWETLDARGLIPAGYVGRFACEACGGTELTGADGRPRPAGSRGGWMCACHGEPLPHPFDVAMLASWASLGFAAGDDHPGILRAEELAREIAGDVRWGVSGRPPQAMRGADEGSPGALLNAAGIRWEWLGGDVDRATLYVPPLGLVS